MLSWLPWKLPGCQMSTLAKSKLQTSPGTIQTRNALDQKCTQISPGTVLKVLYINKHVNIFSQFLLTMLTHRVLYDTDLTLEAGRFNAGF